MAKIKKKARQMYVLREKTTIADEYGKCVLPKMLRGVLGVRKGYRIYFDSCEKIDGDKWVLNIEVLPKI